MKRLLPMFLAAAVCISSTACSPTSGGVTTGNKAGVDAQMLSGQITGEITVSCYEPMIYKEFLESAAVAFEEKYPGTKVNVDTFSSMPEIKTSSTEDGRSMSIISKPEDNQEKEDYINKINTELMSGQGADVLAIDVLPYYKYAEGGQLDDLNEYIEADSDFDRSIYMENVLDAARYNGGMYIFPMDYTFEYFAFDGSLVDTQEQSALLESDAYTYGQLVEMGKPVYERMNDGAEENRPMFGMMPSDIVDRVLKADYSKYIDVAAKKVNLDDGQFAELLKTVSGYADEGYVRPETVMKRGEMMSMDVFEKSNAERFLYKAMSSPMLLQSFNKDANFMNITFGGGGGGGNSEDDEIAGLVSGDSGEIAFSFTQAYGINSNSENKATAWAFIKFLAGEEMQMSMMLARLPINTTVLAEKTKQQITGEIYAGRMGDRAAEISTELTPEQEEILAKYLEVVNKFSGRINTLPVTDTIIDEIIKSELVNYFNGTKTAEEVASFMQNKIQLYLSE